MRPKLTGVEEEEEAWLGLEMVVAATNKSHGIRYDMPYISGIRERAMLSVS